MQFSLILASRERLPLLRGLLQSLVDTTQSLENIEVLIAFDEDDTPSQRAIPELTDKFPFVRIFSRIRSEWLHRDYINWLCPSCQGKYVIVLNDDTKFVNQNWDALAWQRLEEYLTDKPDGIVYGFTDTFSKDKNLCFFPLVSKKAIDALGFILPNERKNWSADHDIFAIYTHPLVNRKLNLPEIKIQHISYHSGLRKRDAVSFHIEKVYRGESAVHIPTTVYADRLASCIHRQPSVEDNQVLAVYNICGISGKENYAYYLSALFSILHQKFNGLKVVISSCLTSKSVRDILTDNLGNKVSYNWINEKLPLNVTFNHTVMKCIKEFGPFENYLYIDSGVTFGSNRHVVKRMQEAMTPDYAMISAQVDIDGGYHSWGLKPTDQDYVMPVGKAVNLHCQMFNHSLYEAYGRILPDIFAHHTSESVYTFMNAVIKKKWLLLGDLKVHHEYSMDGASSGFLYTHPLLFKSAKSIEQISNQGKPMGFGYEECRRVAMHDHSKFDEDGYAKDERLYPFLKENLFCSLNYETIQHDFVRETQSNAKPIPSPPITCLMVSHNKPRHVKEAIESVLAQDMDDWQLIIMDSGVLYDRGFFKEYNDPRIEVYKSSETEKLRQTKAMAPYCFNECFRRNLVKGYLVCYLCDDDVFYPNAFSVFTDYVSQNLHVHALYASQDMVSENSSGEEFMAGERRALVKRGDCVAGGKLDCIVDYQQFCHTKQVLDWLPNKEYWPENLATQSHADGIFMETVGKVVPIYPVDIKVGQNRRTPISKHNPSLI